MQKELGLDKSAGGFPAQLTSSRVKSLAIPVVGFHEAALGLKKYSTATSILQESSERSSKNPNSPTIQRKTPKHG